VPVTKILGLVWKRIEDYLRPRQLLKRMLGGAIWTVLGTAISRFFSMVTNIVVARMLGKEDFGAYGILGTTLETLSIFAGMSLGFTLIKYTAEYRDRDLLKTGHYIGAARTTAYFAAGIMSAILFACSNDLATTILNRTDLEGLLKLGAVYLFIRTVNNIQIGTLIGFEAFRETARINTLTGVLTPLVTLPLVYYLDLTGGMLAMILITGVAYVLCNKAFRLKCERKKIQIKLFDPETLRVMPSLFSYSVPAFLSGVMLMPVMWITTAILVNQTDGYSELGLFNAARQWQQFVVLVPTMVSTVMLAISADTYADESKDRYRQAYSINVKLTWMYALPAAVVVIILATPLNSLFGEKYTAAAALITPLMVASFFSVLNTVCSTAVTGAGRMWAEVGINLVWAAIMLGFSLWLVPLHGGMGLAHATLLAGFGQIVMRLVYIDRALISGSLREILPLAMLSTFVLGTVMLITWLGRFDNYWGLTLLAVGLVPIIRQARHVLSNPLMKAKT